MQRAAAGAVALVTVLAIVPVVVAQDRGHLDGPNVIRYAAPAEAEATQVVRGARSADGGCQFTLTGQGVKGKALSGLDEAAFDPTTCETELVARNGAGGSRGAAAGSGSGAGDVRRDGDIGSAYGGGATCYNPYKSGGYFPKEACIRSWFTDPVNIVVAELTNQVQWTPSGGCATAGAEYSSCYATWLWPSGWYLPYNSFDPSFDCSAVVSKNVTVFFNNTFCLGTLTAASFSPQEIKGFANGTYTWFVQWAKAGVCSSLLTFRTESSG